MADLADALQEIVDELHNVQGLRNVPDAPPESNDLFPFAVVYPESGEYAKQTYGWALNFVNVNIELHVARVDLPRDYVELVGLVDKLPRQLETGLQAGRFSVIGTWDGPITFTFGALSWGGVETLGATYTMRIKLSETIT